MDRRERPSAPVLIVDDEPAVRESMRWLLELEGYHVEIACHGQHALDLLRNGLRPCIILLDLMMPTVDGREFRTQQLASADLARIPVVVYSGHCDPEHNAAALGAVGYFRKPIDIDTVLTLIDAHCTR